MPINEPTGPMIPMETSPESAPGSGGSAGGGWGAAVASAVNLFGQMYQNNQNETAQGRQNAYNKDMADLAYQREIEMWNRANDYNSPLNQRQRYAMAGINPNMGFSGGSGNPGNSGQLPHYNAPTGQINAFPTDFMGALSTYQNFQMRKAQIDNVKAQTEQTNQNTVLSTLKQNLTEEQTHKTQVDYGQKESLWAYTAAMKEEEARQAPLKTSTMIQQMANMSNANALQILQKQMMDKQLTLQDVNTDIARAQLEFKKNENQWRSLGVTSGDSPQMRILAKMLSEFGLNIPSGVNYVKKNWLPSKR